MARRNYGIVLLGEPFSLAAVAGLALILAGSWLAVSGRVPSLVRRTGPFRSSAPAPARVR
jgi:drug/metabolite transporter (DMT)-like permease